MPNTKKWADIRAQASADDPGFEAGVADARTDLLAEIGLHELRRRRALSQTVLAEQLGITQSAVSQLERSPDPKLSTLRDYIEGLGGELVLQAAFDDGACFALTLGEVTTNQA